MFAVKSLVLSVILIDPLCECFRSHSFKRFVVYGLCLKSSLELFMEGLGYLHRIGFYRIPSVNSKVVPFNNHKYGLAELTTRNRFSR